MQLDGFRSASIMKPNVPTLLCLLTFTYGFARASTPITAAYRWTGDLGFGAISNDYAVDQGVDSSGNLYVLSSTQIYGSAVWLVQKFDLNGRRLWASPFIENGAATNMSVDAIGNVSVIGYVWTPYPLNDDTDIAIARFNSNGVLQWATTFDGGNTIRTSPLPSILKRMGTRESWYRRRKR